MLEASLVSRLSEPRSNEMSSCVGALKQLPMTVTLSTKCQQIFIQHTNSYRDIKHIPLMQSIAATLKLVFPFALEKYIP